MGEISPSSRGNIPTPCASVGRYAFNHVDPDGRGLVGEGKLSVTKKSLSKISAGIDRYRSILAAARKRDVSESDTVVMVGDMLADVLGYEKYVEISTEFAVKSTYVDLAVKVGGDIHYLVEVKAIGVDLKDNHVRQAVDYGANQGVEWAILTNGAVWRIYRIEFKKPISHVLVAQLDLLADKLKPSDAIEFFVNLCKEGFAKSQMEEFYERHQATNKHTLAAVLLSDHMLNQFRLGLKRIFPGVQIDVKDLEGALMNEVLKRELVEGEEAEAAAALVKKVTRAAARQKRKAKAASATAAVPPATVASAPPPAAVAAVKTA